VSGGFELKLAPLGAVSPSLAGALESCPLKAALQHSPSVQRLRRTTPPLALGSAAHAVIEGALTGRGVDVDSPRDGLEAVWNTAIENAMRLMAEQAPFEAPPPAERWPGYQRVRVRALRMAEGLLRERPRAHGGEGRTSIRVERSLVSRDGDVTGRPDRVEQADGDTRIIDLKTGRHGDDAVTPAERRQLLFYAYLWHDESGSWPTVGSIETGDGRRLEIKVDPAEAEACVREAVAARDELNSQIVSGAAPATLAHVEIDECQHCSFRVVCDSYWSAASSEAERFLQDVRGVITEVDATGSATLNQVFGTLPSQEIRVRGLGDKVTRSDVGRTLTLQDLSPRQGGSEVVTNWQSDYWLSDSVPDSTSI
jgi:RecB family exonuclease